jgi:parvulin-like peptidyl-prolyl isomerase
MLAVWPLSAIGDDYAPMGQGGGPAYYPSTPVVPSNINGGYGVMPGPPSAPVQTVRPESWPGAAPPAASPRTPWASAGARPCEQAQILARVGSDVVTSGDVLAGIDELLERNKDKLDAGQRDKQRAMIVATVETGLGQLLAHISEPNPADYVDTQARMIIQQIIRQIVQTKLVYEDFHRNVPAESLPGVEKQLQKEFQDKELTKLLKRENVQSRKELEERLRARGSSLDREKQVFFEKVISQQWVHEQLKVNKEVTHEQMLAWYHGHATEFDKPARARYEELAAFFSRYPDRQQAYAAVARMGNQVLAGAGFAEVAKAQSDGLTAASGGRCDWTTKGSLASAELDRALFGLPVGQFSPIIEGRSAYHIIRVVQRQDASRTPFLEAQKDVQEKINKERLLKEYTAYVTRLQKQYPMWSIFDDPAKKALTAEREEPSRY